jgi:hypothetical protein
MKAEASSHRHGNDQCHEPPHALKKMKGERIHLGGRPFSPFGGPRGVSQSPGDGINVLLSTASNLEICRAPASPAAAVLAPPPGPSGGLPRLRPPRASEICLASIARGPWCGMSVFSVSCVYVYPCTINTHTHTHTHICRYMCVCASTYERAQANATHEPTIHATVSISQKSAYLNILHIFDLKVILLGTLFSYLSPFFCK